MSPMVAATPETTLMINGILDFDPEKENGTLKRERETHKYWYVVSSNYQFVWRELYVALWKKKSSQ